VAFVAIGELVFGVHVHGSYAAVMLVSLFGGMSFTGLSLLIAARAPSTEVASGWMNFVMLPMWLLSGSLFSYERFPEVMHPLIRLLPLTALNDALRAVINDGASIVALGGQIAVLATWGGVCFAMSLRLFRWQ